MHVLRATATLTGVVLAIVAASALANSVTVSWTNPTANTDGTTIPAAPNPGSLVSTRIEWGTCSGTAFGTKAGEVVVNQPATSTTIQNLAAGQTFCFRAYAKNTFGAESGPSNVVSKLIPVPVPNPPSITTISVVAWEIQVKPGGIRVVQVGTVPLGSPCGAQISDSYYEIDPAIASLRGSYKGGTLVAKCAQTG